MLKAHGRLGTTSNRSGGVQGGISNGEALVFRVAFKPPATIGMAQTTARFDGVATVVLKLFNQVAPDIALFGEKDWQQLAVIRRMARDLDLTHPAAPAIIGVPTVREADDLARSSRNAYLTAQQRAAAPELPAAMRAALAAIAEGATVATALESLSARLLGAGFASIDYAELRDAETLELINTPGTRPARLLVAARIGKARLIDNMPLG